MSGIWQDSKAKYPSGKLAYLKDAGFNVLNSGFSNGIKIERVRSGETETRRHGDTEEEICRFTHSPIHPFTDSPICIEPLDYKPAKEWSDVTEEIQYIRKRHGDDWVVLGRAFHRVFEGMSKGYITMNNLGERITSIIRNEMLSDSKLNRMKDIILSDIRRLDDAGYLKEIVLPRDDSYAELPFVFETGGKIYKGRVDRVIIKKVSSQLPVASSHEDKIACIYDYKTYPVREDEIPYLLKNYSFQMKIYREAVERIFSFKKIRVYLFFTHKPAMIMVN
jgi:uncharacterized protein YbaR (Trm112 family)